MSSKEKNEPREVWDVLRDHAAQEEVKQNPSDSNEQSVPEPDNSAEQPVSGYSVVDKMGSGSTGVVFKAQHLQSKKMVALKLLYPSHDNDPKVLQQFITEGMTLVKLDHPNIIKGLDFGFSNNFYFLALELAKGESILSFIEKGVRFSEKQTFALAFHLCEALSYLQEQKIVHRDIKPGNILVVESLPKLCDFSLALDLNNSENSQKPGEITCGTVEYISPEQARGDVLVDSRSDVYSLGMTCIHMLTGKLPFCGEDNYEIMRQHIYEEIDWSQLGEISPKAQEILTFMTEKNKDYRLPAHRLSLILKKYLARYQNKKT